MLFIPTFCASCFAFNSFFRIGSDSAAICFFVSLRPDHSFRNKDGKTPVVSDANRATTLPSSLVASKCGTSSRSARSVE